MGSEETTPVSRPQGAAGKLVERVTRLEERHKSLVNGVREVSGKADALEELARKMERQLADLTTPIKAIRWLIVLVATILVGLFIQRMVEVMRPKPEVVSAPWNQERLNLDRVIPEKK